MFILAVVIIFCLAFVLALLSLRKELKSPKEIEMTKKELMKEKILFVKD
ncbi:MAG: hypothetical protein Q7T54_06435 [Candidatus Levybacteria bacterium]|nr:hypothetical protein [Candidatus Levybacteria bacterium]